MEYPRQVAHMAYVMNLGDETDIRWLYNVSYPVGPRGSNRRDDVQLVQHAINIIHNAYMLYDDNGRLIMADLKRDGICGPRTIEGIAAYQRNLGRGKQEIECTVTATAQFKTSLDQGSDSSARIARLT